MRIKTDIQTIMYMEEQISQASIFFFHSDENVSVGSLLKRQVEGQSRELACGIHKKF